MRHLGKLAAAGLTIGVVATSCGGVADVLAGLTPGQVMTLAGSKVVGQSYRMALHGTVSTDASQVQGLPPEALSQMAAFLKSFTVDGRGDVQDSQHARLAMTMSLPGAAGRQFVAELYGGHYYVSTDGGKAFADAGSFDLQGIAASPNDVRSLLAGTVDARNLGVTTHDGQRVEHVHANLGPNYISDVLDKVGGSGAAASALQGMRALLRQAMQVRSGTVDAYVRTVDGRVEDVESHVVLSLDMGRLITALMQQFGGQIPSGSQLPQVSGDLLLDVSGSDRFSDYGAKITISKPSVDPNAPGFSSLFGSGGA